MDSPWVSSQRPSVERPWVGMAMLAAIPLLSLILIRMLWSGSGLWFLTVGIILLGMAAVTFLARRPQERDYGRPALAQEPNRLPLVLTGLGVLFLVLLLLPNFAGGDDGPPGIVQQQSSSGAISSEVSGASQPPAAVPQAQPAQPESQPPVQSQSPAQPVEEVPAVVGETYIVEDGDTLWDIALRFGTTVEAIIEANDLDSPADLTIGQELIIPPPSEDSPEAGAGTIGEETTGDELVGDEAPVTDSETTP